MKCPLFMAMQYALADRICPSEAECLREECAWWDGVNDTCVIHSIGGFISILGMNMGIIIKELTLLRPN
jgi:hypothetical protein